jgi:nitrate reductase gamma subunit
MADKFWYFVLVPMVYLSISWCLVWMVIRIVAILQAPKLPKTHPIFPETRGPDDPPSGALSGAIWDAFTMPTIRKIDPRFWGFLIFFHISALSLLLVHLDLIPRLRMATSGNTIGSGGVGLVFTICLLYFLFRRFSGPVREVSVFSDFFVLIVLFLTAFSGDVISWGNSWTDSGFTLTKLDFGLYISNLIRFTFADPKQFLQGGHYPVIGSHVLMANLFFILLPFSKIMHFCFAVPLTKLRRG